MPEEQSSRSLGARHARVYLALRSAIESGQLAPGQKLSSQAHLAAQHGVALGTLHEVVGTLEREGYLVRRHGVGTFVAMAPPVATDPLRALARLMTQSFGSIQEQVDAALVLVAEQVGMRSAFLSRVEGDQLAIVADYDNAGCGIRAGSSFPLGDAF